MTEPPQNSLPNREMTGENYIRAEDWPQNGTLYQWLDLFGRQSPGCPAGRWQGKPNYV